MRINKFFTLAVAASLMIGFTSCDNVDDDLILPDTENGGSGNEENPGDNNGETDLIFGEGTEENPYTVAWVLDKSSIADDDKEIYFKAYIVGAMSGQVYSQENALFDVSEITSIASNVLLAYNAGETDVEKCIPIQLVAQTEARTLINLKDNKGNMNAEVVFKADLATYFGRTGIKNIVDSTVKVTPIEGESGDNENIDGMGDGTKENPYLINWAIAKTSITAADKGVYFKGYAVGTMDGQSYTQSGAQLTADAISINSNMILSSDKNMTDIDKGIPVQLPFGDIRTALNLVENKDFLGKEIIFQADLDTYFGRNGIKNIVLETVTVDGKALTDGETPEVPEVPETPIEGEGEGTEISPYTATWILAQSVPDLGISIGEYYTTGYIVGYIDGSSLSASTAKLQTAEGALASNLLIAANKNETDYSKCIPVQLPSGSDARKQLNLKDNSGNLGAKLTVKGSLEKYMGVLAIKTPDATTIVLEGVTEPSEPEEPEIPSEVILNAPFFTDWFGFTQYNVIGSQKWELHTTYGSLMSGYSNDDKASYDNEIGRASCRERV